MAITTTENPLPDEHHNAILTLTEIAKAHTRHAKAAVEILDLIKRLEEAGKDPARAYEHAHMLSGAFGEGGPSHESEAIGKLYDRLWTESAILTGRQTRNPDGSLGDYKPDPEFDEDAEGE